jgi:hypothetical protein
MRYMGAKFGVLPGLDDNLPMARRFGRSDWNIYQGMAICHIVKKLYVMLTAMYKGFASAGYQLCRVPGDWVKSGWDSCVSLTSNYVQRSKPAVCIGDDRIKELKPGRQKIRV